MAGGWFSSVSGGGGGWHALVSQTHTHTHTHTHTQTQPQTQPPTHTLSLTPARTTKQPFNASLSLFFSPPYQVGEGRVRPLVAKYKSILGVPRGEPVGGLLACDRGASGGSENTEGRGCHALGGGEGLAGVFVAGASGRRLYSVTFFFCAGKGGAVGVERGWLACLWQVLRAACRLCAYMCFMLQAVYVSSGLIHIASRRKKNKKYVLRPHTYENSISVCLQACLWRVLHAAGCRSVLV